MSLIGIGTLHLKSNAHGSHRSTIPAVCLIWSKIKYATLLVFAIVVSTIGLVDGSSSSDSDDSGTDSIESAWTFSSSDESGGSDTDENDDKVAELNQEGGEGAGEERGNEGDLEEQTVIIGQEIDFRTAALELLNFYRSRHGAPNLILDPKLNKQAQAWADTLSAKNTLEYSCKTLRCKYTESIALLEPSENASAAAKSAIQEWYKEGIKYSYKYGALSLPPSQAKNVADFTTMLWKSSKKVGFGSTEDKNGDIIFVAQYAPAGNVPGKYGKNVLP